MNVRSRSRVSKYGVDVKGFEDVLSSMDLLTTKSPVLLIDEIGKMECFSRLFIDTMRKLLDSDKVLVAIISARGGGFIEEVKGRSDCEYVEVNPHNRDSLAGKLASKVREVQGSS